MNKIVSELSVSDWGLERKGRREGRKVRKGRKDDGCCRISLARRSGSTRIRVVEAVMIRAGKILADLSRCAMHEG